MLDLSQEGRWTESAIFPLPAHRRYCGYVSVLGVVRPALPPLFAAGSAAPKNLVSARVPPKKWAGYVRREDDHIRGGPPPARPEPESSRARSGVQPGDSADTFLSPHVLIRRERRLAVPKSGAPRGRSPVAFVPASPVHHIESVGGEHGAWSQGRGPEARTRPPGDPVGQIAAGAAAQHHAKSPRRSRVVAVPRADHREVGEHRHRERLGWPIAEDAAGAVAAVALEARGVGRHDAGARRGIEPAGLEARSGTGCGRGSPRSSRSGRRPTRRRRGTGRRPRRPSTRTSRPGRPWSAGTRAWCRGPRRSSRAS